MSTHVQFNPCTINITVNPPLRLSEETPFNFGLALESEEDANIKTSYF